MKLLSNCIFCLRDTLPKLDNLIIDRSFTLHTLSSLSFMVNKEIPISKEGERETFFDDEVFHRGSIAPKELREILLPKYLTRKPICQVPF